MALKKEPRFLYVAIRHIDRGPFDVVARYDAHNDQKVLASCTSRAAADAAMRLMKL